MKHPYRKEKEAEKDLQSLINYLLREAQERTADTKKENKK